MDESSRQFMMWGGLMLTVIIFSAIAFFIVTRPGFKNRSEGGASGMADTPGTAEGPVAEEAETEAAVGNGHAPESAPDASTGEAPSDASGGDSGAD